MDFNKFTIAAIPFFVGKATKVPQTGDSPWSQELAWLQSMPTANPSSQEDTTVFAPEQKKQLHLNNFKVCNKINKVNSTDPRPLPR